MDQAILAIYEHGVLRPLTPLPLNEDEVVSVTIARPGGGESASPTLKCQADHQRELLLQFVAKMESFPDNSPKDGLTNRDHDRLIYGP